MKTSTREIFTNSAMETKNLAGKFSTLLKPGDIILFSGELGAGKTTFIQGLGSALGVKANILSPTFVIAHQYEGRLKIHHLDLYRLDNIDELEPLLRDLPGEDGILLVEWGEKLEKSRQSKPAEYLGINSRFTDSDALDERILEFIPKGESWETRILNFIN